MFTASEACSRRLLAAGFCALVLSGCTDGLSPALNGSATSLALSARMSVVGTSETTYTRVRLRILRLPELTELAVCESAVTATPPSEGWQIPCEIALDANSLSVRVEVSLYATSGGAEYVAWSGEQGPIEIVPGEVAEPEPVNLFPGPPENLTISAIAVSGPDELLEEDGATLNAQVTGGPTSPQILWLSQDPEIATVNADGRIEALQPGVAHIVAAAGRVTDTHEITVLPRPVAVEVTPGEADLVSFGETVELSARVVDRRGDEVDGHTVAWSILSGAAVEHVGEGVFRAVANGESTVQAVADFEGITGTAVLRVAQALAELVVTPDDVDMNAFGATQQLTLQAFDAGGNEIAVPGAIWSSADESVATVSQEGVVTTVGNGTTTITALVEGATASAQVKVEQAAQTIEVSPAEIELEAIEATGQFTAVAFDANGNEMPDVAFDWDVLNGDVAQVDQNGVVEALANGRATVRVRAGDARGEARVIVEQEADHVVIEPAELMLAVNESAELSATVVDANGFAVPGEFAIAWSSGNAEVASVSETGVVTGTGPGETSITATSGVYTGSVPVSVEGVVLPPGGIAGIVTSALSAVPIAGAQVKLVSGETPVAETTTDETGHFNFSEIPAGNYTLSAEAQGFTEANVAVTVVGGATASVTISLSPVLTEGEWRIVLNWNPTPSDLDSHLITPADGGCTHVYYGCSGSETSAPYARLDRDDTSGSGPETITITQQYEGTYRYYVYLYCCGDNSTMSASGARVDVYNASGQVASFTVPEGSGRFWNVFELNGGTLTPVNTVTTSAFSASSASWLEGTLEVNGDRRTKQKPTIRLQQINR